jgi:hypothetical protein
MKLLHGGVWSKRGRIDYILDYLSDQKTRYKQIDTIEGIEIFEQTGLPKRGRGRGRKPTPLWRLCLYLSLTFLLPPLLALAVGVVFSHPILSIADLPMLRINLSKAFEFGIIGGIIGLGFSFFGSVEVLSYLQWHSAMTILNRRAKCTLQRTGLIRRSGNPHSRAGYWYGRKAWYRYAVDGVDHEIAEPSNVFLHDFQTAVEDIAENPWRTHRTIRYLSNDPARVRCFYKKFGNPIGLILHGIAWLAGLSLVLIAGACLRY